MLAQTNQMFILFYCFWNKNTNALAYHVTIFLVSSQCLTYIDLAQLAGWIKFNADFFEKKYLLSQNYIFIFQ